MGLVSFYRDGDKDHAGRDLFDILSFSNDELEGVHDYIQWLFPLPERSQFQPHVPVLTAGDIETFRTSGVIQNNMRLAFSRMLTFYGFQDDGQRIEKAKNFPERSENWLNPGDHNFLRLTRILRSLSLSGLEPEARRLFDALEDVAADPAYKDVIGNSYSFWRQQIYPANKSPGPGLKP